MKTLILLIALSINTSAFAGNLYYSDGPAKGKEVSKVPTYVGIDTICFVGSGFAAKSSLHSILDNDNERSSLFTYFNKNKDILVYGYVENKCVDDGEDSVNCRVVKNAKRCL